MEAFTDISDICQQLLDRYGKSSAPQHRHLCATAAVTRSLLQTELLPLTPFSYFAAAISTLSDKTAQLDHDALAAVSSFLSIVLPLVKENAIAPDKAKEAVEVVVERINSDANEASLGSASVRALVKSLGVLLNFCDLEDWDSVKLGFNTLLNFSIDKRPKVRKCAQDCLLALFKSSKSSAVINEASKSVYSLLKDQMPLAIKSSDIKAVVGSKVELMSKPEHQEVVHMLNVLKIIVPHLSVKVCAEVLSQLMKLLTSEFPAFTKHIFEIIQVMFESSKFEVSVCDAEKVIKYLVSYISLKEKNRLDSVLCAATLSKHAIDKLHARDMMAWISLLPLVIGSVAGLLNSEAGTALQASNILKELINLHIDEKFVLATSNQVEDDESVCHTRLRALESVCGVFDNLLKAGVVPNEHCLGIISVLFLRLGDVSGIYMKSIILKLAEVMNSSSTGASDRENLQKCIGSAVVAMGPEKLLALLPISLNSADFSCSNIWLMPILKEYVVGSSLQFFVEYFVTLADSFRRQSKRVSKSEVSKDLEDYASDCWELLPAFCRFPTDTHKNFGSLTKILVPLIRDSAILESVAISLQELVNQNKRVLSADGLLGTKLPKAENIPQDLSKQSYSKKIANKNIKALASCSEELLQALIDVFLELPSDRHESLKGAIGCLASISDPSMIKSIFVSVLKRLQLIKDLDESGELKFHTNSLGDSKETDASSREKDAKRCLALKLASCFVNGASEEMVDLLFKVAFHALEVTEGIGLPEAYQTLCSVLEKHASFCSSQFVGVMDLFLKLKSPSDIALLKSRFGCLQTLLIHILKENLDGGTTKAFLILNEIILALKDSKEESRKAAYDILTGTTSSLRNISCSTFEGPYQKLISMVLGYLADASPHIKSGAVSALSVLIYSDTDICISMPELVPSVLELLQSKKKAVEVIKAILGFVKVLVSSLQAKDLQNFLRDIVNGILPWSSMSRHHFRSKVTVIMEILIRKFGVALIQPLVPAGHRDFLQNVLENRRGKTSSKETGTSETEMKPSDLSQKGWTRRKREESAMLPKEEGSKFSRKRPREKREKGSIHSAKEPYKSSGHINAQKSMKVKENSHRRKSQWPGKDTMESPSKAESRGKRKREMSEASEKAKGGSHKPAAKLAKRRRAGKKRVKTEK